MRYVPQFDHVNTWARRWAKYSVWRVRPVMDEDDLFSEAYCVYARCAEKYPHVSRAEFFTLFKRSLVNQITDLANERTAKSALELDALTEEGDLREMGVESTTSFSDLKLSAPAPILNLINAFSGEQRIPKPRKDRLGRPEPINPFLCRILGLDPRENDVCGMVKGWLAQVSPEFELPFVV